LYTAAVDTVFPGNNDNDNNNQYTCTAKDVCDVYDILVKAGNSSQFYVY